MIRIFGKIMSELDMDEQKKLTFESLKSSDTGTKGPSDGDNDWEKDCCESIFTGMCCWVYWCGPCTVGQAWNMSKQHDSDPLKRLVCNLNACSFYLTFVLALSIISYALTWLITSPNPDSTIVLIVQTTQQLLMLAVSIFTLGVIYQARTKVRDHYDINESDLKSGCCACWCGPCTILQLFAQEKVVGCGGSGDKKYKLCSNGSEFV